MECFLLLLAVGLASPDKLDRTYLPPPGALLSGGTLDDLQIPLEYSERRKPMVAIQNDEFRGYIPKKTFSESPSDQDIGKALLRPTTPVDFSKSTNCDEISQSSSLTTNSCDFTVEALKPDKAFYDNFSPKVPGYLPSQSQTMTSLLPVINPTVKTPSVNAIMESATNEEGAGYYYNVPALPIYGNNIANHRPNEAVSTNTQQFELFQYPNQNDSFLQAIGEAFIPKPATTGELAENYQTSTFGYSDRNPMIMTYQNVSSQGLGNVGLRSKFGEFENVLPMMPADQDKQISNAPINFEQRSSVPVSSTFRHERPQAESDRTALITNYKNLITPEGYSYSFDTSNWMRAHESGTENDGVKATGSYSYIGDDGKNYSVSYTADENGFRPIGDHIPTPPPIPEAIKKVIEQASRDKAAGIIDDGSYDDRKYGHMNYQGAMERYRPINNTRIPNVNQRVGTTSSDSNKIRNNPTTITEIDNKKKANDAPIYNGYIPKNRSKETTRNQFEIENNQYPAFNQQGPKNKLPTQETTDSTKTSLIKSEENYLGRHPSNGKIDDNQNIHTNVNTSENDLQEHKATSSTGLAENVPDIYNTELQDQSRRLSEPTQHRQLSSIGTKTHVDDGYYYVPPFIKFNEIPEQFGNKKNSFITNNKPAPNDEVDSVLKRIGVDYTQTIDKVNPVTPNTKSTRKPYITGPDDQNFTYEYTTPTSTKHRNQPINDYSTPFYQTTTNTSVGEQILSSTVENRMNTLSEIPGISVSQKFVATTNRPINLEVNQNVKIYGFGESKPVIATNRYSDKIDNDGFYPTPIPSDESRFTGYPNQPTGNFDPEITEKGTIANDYTSGFGAPADGNLIQTEPYFNPDIGRVNSFGILNTHIPIQNIFGNPELPSDQAEGTNPTFTTQSQSMTAEAIGEDFSGPKQPYGFNPETGYYYK